jgi:hypothetical protein
MKSCNHTVYGYFSPFSKTTGLNLDGVYVNESISIEHLSE